MFVGPLQQDVSEKGATADQCKPNPWGTPWGFDVKDQVGYRAQAKTSP